MRLTQGETSTVTYVLKWISATVAAPRLGSADRRRVIDEIGTTVLET